MFVSTTITFPSTSTAKLEGAEKAAAVATPSAKKGTPVAVVTKPLPAMVVTVATAPRDTERMRFELESLTYSTPPGA